MTTIGTNWAGNHTYRAAALERPDSLDALREVVAGAPLVRALGSRHSFSDLTDTRGVLVDLSGLPDDVAVDEAARTVSVSGGVRYGDLARALEDRGWALANLASLPHISVAGAVATGTHGSGNRNRSLAAAVASVDVMGPDGEVRHLARGDADFDGSVVALGALGVVTRLELDVEPTYLVRQEVRTGLTWDTVERRFDDITGAGYSVSMFTRFDGDGVTQLWVKSRADEPALADVFDTVPAADTMHMLRGGSTEAVTGQGGEPGPWLDRLPHFRMEFTPSNGEELQAEYFVPREHAVAGIEALRGIGEELSPLLEVAEIRTIAGDEHWLSGAHGRDTVGFHFTFRREEPAVRGVARRMEEVLAPFDVRPHWGKVFEMDAPALAAVFPRLGDFADLRERVDPQHVFGNAFLDRVLP
ncbi:FAD-binding protein [Phycicoccus flavus]|uniref:FAD-binding protein n=1 Tax=Phycicoccus flavus TaxID=2502783 RepID=UPI000FEBC488|nr:FAD-binding protein [Phycicoccus flavus]NHA66500.1 FAD-binding protein [Phycicoccus flavus]